MTKGQFNTAMHVIDKILDAGAYAKTIYALREISQQTKEVRQKLISEELGLLEKFNGSVNADGRVVFKDDDAEREFREREFRKALLEYVQEEVDVKVNPVELSLDELDGVRITNEEFEAVSENFINFTR